MPSANEFARGANLQHPLLANIRPLVAWFNRPGLIGAGGGGSAINEVTREVVSVGSGITNPKQPWAKFDGSSSFQFTTVGDTVHDPMWVIAWAHKTNNTGTQYICSHGGSWRMGTTWGNYMRVTEAGVEVDHDDDANSYVTATFYGFQIDGAGLTMYSDRNTNGRVEAKNTDTVGDPMPTPSNDFFVGCRPSTEYWDAYIAGVMYGRGVLGIEQLNAIYSDMWFLFRRDD